MCSALFGMVRIGQPLRTETTNPKLCNRRGNRQHYKSTVKGNGIHPFYYIECLPDDKYLLCFPWKGDTSSTITVHNGRHRNGKTLGIDVFINN